MLRPDLIPGRIRDSHLAVGKLDKMGSDLRVSGIDRVECVYGSKVRVAVDLHHRYLLSWAKAHRLLLPAGRKGSVGDQLFVNFEDFRILGNSLQGAMDLIAGDGIRRLVGDA